MQKGSGGYTGPGCLWPERMAENTTGSPSPAGEVRLAALLEGGDALGEILRRLGQHELVGVHVYEGGRGGVGAGVHRLLGHPHGHRWHGGGLIGERDGTVQRLPVDRKSVV